MNKSFERSTQRNARFGILLLDPFEHLRERQHELIEIFEVLVREDDAPEYLVELRAELHVRIMREEAAFSLRQQAATTIVRPDKKQHKKKAE